MCRGTSVTRPINSTYTPASAVNICGTGMRLGFGQNSGKFYDTIDSNPIQHRRF